MLDYDRNQTSQPNQAKEISQNGKPSERVGRKASGLKPTGHAGAAAVVSLLDI